MERNLPFTYRKPGIRWLDYARRSWQRLGHLKLICSVASPSQGMNLEGITARFQSKITAFKRISDIPEQRRDQVLEHIGSRRSNRHTKSEDTDSCELQQYYLSDPRLPSQSGALTGRLRSVNYLHTEYVEIPTWAVRLGLLRKGNYTLTERGKALLALQTDGSDTSGHQSSDENPYLLAPSEKYLFFYCLLDADGDLVKRLYRRLVLHTGLFDKSDVSNYMVESLDELRKEIKDRRLSMTYRSIDTQLRGSIEALKNRSEQAVVPRLEPFVDCGLIARGNRQSSIYEHMGGTSVFINNLNGSPSVDDFLNGSLAVNVANLLGLQREYNVGLVPHYVADSYSRLRSGIGYCSIKDLALLAVAASIGSGSGIFEIVDVEQAIVGLAREYGTNVRFTKDRQGNVALVKFDSSLIRELAGAS